MTRLLVLLLALIAPCWLPVSAAAEPVPCARLPHNIVVPDGYAAWLEVMIAGSSTLQTQCRAIAAADHVVVYVAAVGRLPGCCRAKTAFVREEDGRLRALIALPVSVDAVELLAHEFEHVVEQIEGVNLRRLAGRPDSGVWRVGSRFETDRAQHAGRRAAAEVGANRCRSGCAGDLRLVAARD